MNQTLMSRSNAWWIALALSCAGPEVRAEAAEYKRSVAQYAVPDVTLIDQHGTKVRIKDLITPDKPTFLQFVFTSCPTICPILGAIFSSFQTKLGTAADDIHFVSVSIDPEHDDPEKMQAFLSRYHARDNWTFLTGSREDIQAVQKAFDSYTANKMSHSPLTFFSVPAQNRWVRIGGFIGAAELVAEYEGAQRR
jgi:protein SCO1/2